jgi:glutamyl-tRNA synthetase
VSAFRNQGIEPMAVNALLARLGTSDPVEPVTEMAPLIASFDFAHFGRAPARFDEAELAALNQKIVHLLPYEAVADRLPEAIDARAWPVVRPNLATVREAADWAAVLAGEIAAPTFGEEDRAYLAQAAEELAALNWDADPWHALTHALKARTGRKGKPLFLPLRQALTGRDHGPDMAALLPLIGRERALARLAAAASAAAQG